MLAIKDFNITITVYWFSILSVPKLDELPWCQTLCKLPLRRSLQWTGYLPTV